MLYIWPRVDIYDNNVVPMCNLLVYFPSLYGCKIICFMISVDYLYRCRRFDEIFITGCTKSCQNDNFRCSQWLNFIKMTTFPFQCTETEMPSFWWNFHHWLHWKLSKWQLPVQPVIKISSKWQHFRFSDVQVCELYIGKCYLWTSNVNICKYSSIFIYTLDAIIAKILYTVQRITEMNKYYKYFLHNILVFEISTCV